MFDENPFIASPEEVHLSNAPLIRVIAQVRFPTILSIGEGSFIAPFQEEIREKYPILQPEQTQVHVVTPAGIDSKSSSMLWRFLDKNGEWRISLTSTFLSIETSNYISRTDFLQRFNEILLAIDSHLKPRILDRLGLRYVSRLKGEDCEHITDFVRPEIAGILDSEIVSNVEQNINDAYFSVPNHPAKIHARWGLIPTQVTIEPTAIEPINEPSWIFDLDMFSMPAETQKIFEVGEIMDDSERYAERLYSVFRWMVTEEFLKHFGGTI